MATLKRTLWMAYMPARWLPGREPYLVPRAFRTREALMRYWGHSSNEAWANDRRRGIVKAVKVQVAVEVPDE